MISDYYQNHCIWSLPVLTLWLCPVALRLFWSLCMTLDCVMFLIFGLWSILSWMSADMGHHYVQPIHAAANFHRVQEGILGNFENCVSPETQLYTTNRTHVEKILSQINSHLNTSTWKMGMWNSPVRRRSTGDNMGCVYIVVEKDIFVLSDNYDLRTPNVTRWVIPLHPW